MAMDEVQNPDETVPETTSVTTEQATEPLASVAEHAQVSDGEAKADVVAELVTAQVETPPVTPVVLVDEPVADDVVVDAIHAAPAENSSAEMPTTVAPKPNFDDETELDDEFIKEKVAAAKATKGKKAATRKPSTRKVKEKLPDMGDGSGYEAPLPPLEIAGNMASGNAVKTDDSGDWYAIHCYSGYENKVKNSLEQRTETMGMAGKILECVVPTEEEIEVRDGKRKTVERRVFPGYVLVRMKMSEESWYVVRNTPGVTRFIGMGNRPQPLTQQEVNQILKRMEAEAPKIKVNYKPGQKVRITDGPFADLVGLVDKIDTERAKVVVLVSFFGRETPVELDFLQVERM